MEAANKKILLVDDEPEILAELASFLAGVGYCVQVTDTGETALALVETFEPDLVILDVVLLGISGHQVLYQLQEMRQPPRVILLTGHERPLEELMALKAGATDYLAKVHYLGKPFSKDALLARVQKALTMPFPQHVDSR